MPLVRNSFIHLLDNVSSDNCAITLTSNKFFAVADIDQGAGREYNRERMRSLKVSFPVLSNVQDTRTHFPLLVLMGMGESLRGGAILCSN
jgi:hypothetical protein